MKNSVSLEFIKINVLDKHSINSSSFREKKIYYANCAHGARGREKESVRRTWLENEAIDKFPLTLPKLNVHDVFSRHSLRRAVYKREISNKHFISAVVSIK